MSYTAIEYSITDGIAHIVLNKPKSMNAFDAELRDDLREAVKASSANELVKVVVISANGRGFSSGTDLVEAQTKEVYSLLEGEYRPVIAAIRDCPKPVIAAVNGACAGVGASIALACDLVTMSESAFMFLAFAQVGLIPDGGMFWHLVNSVGHKRAYQLMIEGGRISASQCEQFGMANHVFNDETLVSETLSWAQKLSMAAPLTLKFSKQVLQQASEMNLYETLRLEAAAQSICSTSADGKEGIAAFLEKRKPVFTGR